MKNHRFIALVGVASVIVGGIGMEMASAQTSTLNVSVYQPNFGETAQGSPLQQIWLDDMEKYMGQSLAINWTEIPSSEYQTKEPIYLASGRLADISLLETPADIVKAGQEGAIVNLMPYLKKGDMPYYKKFLEQDGNLSKVEDNGQLYSFSDGIYSDPYTNYGTQWSWMYRFDIFKKNHLPIPTSLQQMYLEGLKLKKLYPNSYLIGATVGGLNQWYSLDTVLAIMNHTNVGFYFNGKTFGFGPVTDYGRYEATIEYMHKLYASGLLDPNFLTIQGSQFNSEADQNKFFIVPDGWAAWTNNSQGANLNVKGFSGQWGIAAPPKNLYGQVSWKMSTVLPGFSSPSPWGSVISSRAQNIPQLVKLLDYEYSPQIIDLYNYGVKGVTYTIGKNGQPQFTARALKVGPGEDPSNSPFLNKFPVDPGSTKRIGIQWIPQSRVAEDQIYGDIPVSKDGKYFETTIWHFSSMADGGVKSINPNGFVPVLPLTDQQNNQIASISTNLSTYMEENVAKFITGKESFSQWPAFIKALKSQGNIQQVIDWDNAALSQVEKTDHWSYGQAIGGQ